MPSKYILDPGDGKDVCTYKTQTAAANARLGASLVNPLATVYAYSKKIGWTKLYPDLGSWLNVEIAGIPIKVLNVAHAGTLRR